MPNQLLVVTRALAVSGRNLVEVALAVIEDRLADQALMSVQLYLYYLCIAVVCYLWEGVDSYRVQFVPFLVTVDSYMLARWIAMRRRRVGRVYSGRRYA